MKLSFSTFGWHDRSWEDFRTVAEDCGFAGIEVHNIRAPKFLEKNSVFDAARANAVHRELAEAGLSIPCIDAWHNIADAAAFEENCAEISDYIKTAKSLRIPYVRVGAKKTDGSDEEERAAVFAVIERMLPEAREAGVTLLIETIGIYSDTDKLCGVLNSFACDNLSALWDVQHTFRDAGEAPEKTVRNLGAHIKHVHLKDSAVNEDGKMEYRLVCEGTLPIGDMMRALYSLNYDGFISMEWNPEWMPEIEELELISLHFVNTMNRFDNPARMVKKHRLYENRRGTGLFPWQKDRLIEKTFGQLLDRIVEEFPDQYAFKYTTLNYTRTYSEFRDDVDEFARALISLGVKAGSHIAIWATNLPQWYITFWAAAKIGAVLVTVNTAYKIHEAEYLLRQSDAHTLVTIEGYRDSKYDEIIKELCPELGYTEPGRPLACRRLPFLRNVITVGFSMKGCLTWEEAVARAHLTPAEEVARLAAAVDVHDVCNMQYTSGTTGFPKGVMLTHYNVVNNGKCIGDRMDLSTADRMMIQVPMFHCFGMVLAMTAAMTHAATLSPLPYFSTKASLACINQERITCFHGVPTMFIAMMEHEDFQKTDFSYMRTGIMAGSPCPISKMRDVVEKMNMKEIVIVYGQTEASPGCTMSDTGDSLEVRVETVGHALPEVECRIIHPESGEELPDETPGEFVARGYNIMKGYYKMPEATAAAIDADGWLHTGDIACRTAEGNYKITGRLKDMIIRGGENIYPKELEEFLYTHPKVKDVQVIGVPDEGLGEEIMACVVLKEGESATEDELKKYCLSNMARHKCPRYFDFVEEFPMNAAGKILKYKMREEAVKKLGLQEAASIKTA
ncbi:AMP-binding protein [Synergistes jonesii]|uniref:AMP-dependent synthetase n=1 Tax=Synergistes jonesii TaxID=2754 RepID=A0A073IT37_9BACT|nr:AMP-binding protein [Synergistes jonesii]KEJ92636.1 AMP-dependent synthetase [Synergistes jonesii]OFB63669.1 AMP-dependent synthetase [Synergistes jonesii]OFB63828.1 AMP-dependent synthetase [Synergistes jonesii]OFB64359.1 AMP-dependent synthetase [Synergistes jonesii]OFB67994.1 AMP-dependent synthetase [Synergistes jonesii]